MSIIQITQTVQLVPPASFIRSKKTLQPVLPGLEFVEEHAEPEVTNRQIAEVLAGIADMLASQNANPYRIQAYRNAARGVLDLPEPAAAILKRGEQLPVVGLGNRLRTRIRELVETGTMTLNNGFSIDTLPAGVRALMAVEHIGVYTAIRLYEGLGIDSPEKLWRAAQQQRIRTLFGFGPRSEARLQEAAAQLLRKRKQNVPQTGAA